MDAVIKDMWVKTLRSGKYEQGKKRLHIVGQDGEPDRLCCLGVLCEIAVENGVIPPGTNERVMDYDLVAGTLTPEYVDVVAYAGGESTLLPSAVAEWADLMREDGSEHNDIGGYNLDTEADTAYRRRIFRNALSQDNDEGMTFSQIADLIEEHF